MPLFPGVVWEKRLPSMYRKLHPLLPGRRNLHSHGELRSSGMTSSSENPSCLTAGRSQAAPSCFQAFLPRGSAHFGKHQPLSIYINFSVYYTQTVKKLFYWYLVSKTCCIWPPDSFLFSFVFSMVLLDSQKVFRVIKF